VIDIRVGRRRPCSSHSGHGGTQLAMGVRFHSPTHGLTPLRVQRLGLGPLTLLPALNSCCMPSAGWIMSHQWLFSKSMIGATDKLIGQLAVLLLIWFSSVKLMKQTSRLRCRRMTRHYIYQGQQGQSIVEKLVFGVESLQQDSCVNLALV
jgi:hypothetical protein